MGCVVICQAVRQFIPYEFETQTLLCKPTFGFDTSSHAQFKSRRLGISNSLLESSSLLRLGPIVIVIQLGLCSGLTCHRFCLEGRGFVQAMPHSNRLFCFCLLCVFFLSLSSFFFIFLVYFSKLVSFVTDALCLFPFVIYSLAQAYQVRP